MNGRRKDIAVIIIGVLSDDVDPARGRRQEPRASMKNPSEEISFGIVHEKVGAFYGIGGEKSI
jgi:hypothetical protein